jgi:hypothetical protein
MQPHRCMCMLSTMPPSFHRCNHTAWYSRQSQSSHGQQPSSPSSSDNTSQQPQSHRHTCMSSVWHSYHRCTNQSTVGAWRRLRQSQPQSSSPSRTFQLQQPLREHSHTCTLPTPRCSHTCFGTSSSPERTHGHSQHDKTCKQVQLSC